MRLRGLLGVAVTAAYLEHNAPSAAEALKQSPPAGVRAVVPMLLTAGYHWERDIPAVAAQRGATAILLPPPAPSSFSASVAGLLAGLTDSSGAQKSRVLLASAGSTRPGVVPRFDDLAIGVGAATGTEVLVALSARAVSDLARPGDTVVPVLTGSGFLADRIAAAATAAGARTTAVLGDTGGFARDLAAVIRAALV
jgi:sirohydrochlorin ferrochelatase